MVTKKETRYRLSIFKSNSNISAQIIDDEKSVTLASANSIKEKQGGNVEAAKLVGKELAKNAKDKKITTLYFKRGRNRYEGRIKALISTLRDEGLTI